MSNQIVAVLDPAGEFRVDSRVMAERLGNKHKSVMALVSDYSDEFYQLGQLPFETETVKNSVGAVNETRSALLNEDQCYFLLTLVRNSTQIVALKLALVQAFKAARAATLPALPASPLALMRLTLEQLEAQDARVGALEHRLDASPITSEKVGTVHRLGQQLGMAMGNYRSAWNLFNQRFGLASYRDLPSNRYEEAVQFLRMQVAAYTGTPLLEVKA